MNIVKDKEEVEEKKEEEIRIVKNDSKKKITKISILKKVVQVLVFLDILLVFATRWVFNYFAIDNLEAIVFQLSVPLDGIKFDDFQDGFIKILVYGIFCFIILNIAYFIIFGTTKKILKFLDKKDLFKFFKEKKLFRFFNFNFLQIVSIFLIFAVSFKYINRKSNLISYIKRQITKSNFIEENYVDPKNVTLEFPEKKRNLIYIILESMEVTYGDKGNNGIFEENLIPEITKLMKENTSFSSKTEGAGGIYNSTGSAWTIASMVAEGSGLPLKLDINGNSYGICKNFMPGATTLGDILEKQGYNQMFVCGSDIRFAGRDKFLEQHGKYDILDFNVAVDTKRYLGEKENWGFEDKYVYELAKEEILRLNEENKPFNLTLLTTDTHSPDGYFCEDCDLIHDDPYCDIISCTSRRVNDFVNWIKEQDFYENTTIVIVGDHPTMSTNFMKNVPEGYQQNLVNCFINPVEEAKNKNNRIAAQWDIFPTILASIGVKIEGERLGIGTNLFSNEKTITEEYGREYVEEEITKKSDFYNKTILGTK